VVERASEEKAKRGYADDVSVNGERNVTYAHLEVLSASEGAGRAAVCAFHAEYALRVDSRADFIREVFSYDHDL
jgi:hypothetical protein